MVILKKLKASTLMETLVATVLIVVIFMIASMILNNLFSNTMKNNTRGINMYLNELQYLYVNEKIAIPYYDDFNDWEIEITTYQENALTIIEFEAINKDTQKIVTKLISK
jgi:Tfp pilus assembly protein PilV